jgi:hypothetical protein
MYIYITFINVHIYIHIYIHVYMYIHTYTYIHEYIHTDTATLLQPPLLADPACRIYIYI